MADGLRILAPGRAAEIAAAEAAVVPFRKPHFLGGIIQRLLIEDAGMGDEAVEGLLVHSREVIHGIAAVTGAAGRDLVNIGLGLHLARCAEVVLDVQAAVVSGYLLAPFLSEGGGAAAVGKDDDIALRAHQPVVPAV